MKRRLLTLTLLLILTGLAPAGALADDDLSDDDALSPQALEIANGLNCPVCEGQSVRDSNSQLARDMRQRIQQMLDDGYTEEEVYDYFAHPDRYGPGILREPPKDGFFMTLWWMPVIGVAIGALVLGTFVTQRRSRSSGTGSGQSERSGTTPDRDDDDLSEYEERVLRDLDDDSDSRDRR